MILHHIHFSKNRKYQNSFLLRTTHKSYLMHHVPHIQFHLIHLEVTMFFSFIFLFQKSTLNKWFLELQKREKTLYIRNLILHRTHSSESRF